MGAARCVAADARPVEPLPASGRFELSSAASSQRAVSSRAAVNGGSKSTFDTPLALLQTRAQKPLGQSVLLKAKMRKRAASRERSFDGCPGVAKGMSTASDAYVDFPRQSAGFWARLRLQQVLVSALVVPPRDHLWPPNPQPYTCHRP